MARRPRLLFACVGNSARSQMAATESSVEPLVCLRQTGGGPCPPPIPPRAVAFSSGICGCRSQRRLAVRGSSAAPRDPLKARASHSQPGAWT